MKKWLRIVCLVLVLAFVLPALVACNNDDNHGHDDGTLSGLKKPDTIDGSTYNGSKFTIFSVEDMFEKKYFYSDKTTGDGMNDALYQRKQNVERLLKVELVYKAAEGSGSTPAYTQYSEDVKNAIAAGDAKYQLVLTHAYIQLPDLIDSNSLKDFKELQSINVNKDYWNKDIMDQVSYKGHYYLGYSDFNLAATYVIAFNKKLHSDFSSAFDGKTMYDYVNEGKWTIEQMAQSAQRVYENKGSISSTTYGLTGQLWVPFCGFIHSSGESIVVQDKTGHYSITWDGNQTVKRKVGDVVKMLNNIHKLPETFFWVHSEFNDRKEPEKVTLDSGRAFMQLMKTNELIALKDKSVKFGVLPYPMFNEDQYKTTQYRSLNWAGYLAVPSNNVSNAKMVSDVIECLSFYSGDVKTYYYEKLLGLKVSEAPEDKKMLDIVWDSLCCDFGVVYDSIDKQNLDPLVYTVPQCLMSGVDFTRWANTYTSGAQKTIDNKINSKK